MSYQVLALKYRPQTFDEIWAQDHVKDTLKRAIEQNKIAHAYLFAGPRGVGKTTTARILAKSLCCVNGPTVKPCNVCSACKEITLSRNMDVLEIDGASNRRIEEIRELRENIKYLPTAARYKIYIIDEVHMLTTEAFNALLKTLEEPPKNVVFIFATTASHKVPGTILSRCQRFDFRKATVEEIVKRLEWLTQKEKIRVSNEALHAIAHRAEGAIRDAEVILDQLWAFRPDGIELDAVYELLGIVPGSIFQQYAELVINQNRKGLVEFIDQIFVAGYDTVEFFTGLIEYFRILLLIQLNMDARALELLPDDFAKRQEQSKKFNPPELLTIISTLCSAEEQLKRTLLPKILLEVVSLKLVQIMVKTGKMIENNNPSDNSSVIMESKEVDLTAIWDSLITKLRKIKMALASRLELAAAIKFEEDALYIKFPGKHLINRDHFEENKTIAESVLSEIMGKPAKIISELESDEEMRRGENKDKSGNKGLNIIGNVFEYEEID
jgi:DNA polymerase-3 subunit gamma/tau